MSFRYHWSLGVQIFRRKLRSSIRIMFGIAAATLIAIAGFGAYFQARQTVIEHKEVVTLALFVKPDVNPDELHGLEKDLRTICPAIRTAAVMTPDSVRGYINNQYGVNMSEVLPNNPYPSVILLSFHAEMLSWQVFNALTDECSRIEFIENMAYRSDYIKAVFNEEVMLVWIGIGGFILGMLFITVLLSFSFRAEPTLGEADVHVAEMLGASRGGFRIASLSRIILCSIVGIGVSVGVGLLTLMYTESLHYTHIIGALWMPLACAAAMVFLIASLVSLRSVPR
ncbi:MAG: hypothetical protein JNL32_15010 [Candidatus Kapabacteria bacterium]|nr:hypothetical protein [Candidatus Kapabacteria bacterium]